MSYEISGDQGLVKPGERVDDLVRDSLRIIQHPDRFRFSMDAVLLSSFARVKKGGRVLDLGTGTGVIPLLLSAKTAGHEFYGLEIQSEMADMAARSVALNGLCDKVFIRQGDLKEAGTIYGARRFDTVVSNPPFTTAGTGLVNPADTLAISRHEIMCTLEDVIRAFSQTVVSKGRVAMVHRPHRLVDILSLMRIYGMEPKRLRFVHPKAGQKPNMVLVEALKDGGRELDVMQPLVIYNEDGTYTGEVREIYDGEAES